MVTCAALSAIAGTSVIAVAPDPITTTRLILREATLDECEVAFIIRLAAPIPGMSFERIGLERRRERLLGVEIPMVELPVHPGSNLATLVDLAIRDWQLRLRGINAARRLDERLRTLGSPDGSGPPGAGEAE